jgi:hypothetical protein
MTKKGAFTSGNPLIHYLAEVREYLSPLSQLGRLVERRRQHGHLVPRISYIVLMILLRINTEFLFVFALTKSMKLGTTREATSCAATVKLPDIYCTEHEG